MKSFEIAWGAVHERNGQRGDWDSEDKGEESIFRYFMQTSFMNGLQVFENPVESDDIQLFKRVWTRKM